MNQKYFYISIFLIFALFLSGCNSVIVGNPEIDIESETKRVEDAVHDFWSFIDAQDENNAAWACAPGYDYGSVIRPATKQFVEPYFEQLDYIKNVCGTTKVIVDIYAYIRDISFIWDESGDPRAIIDIQVNRTIMNCGVLNNTIARFGTMELIYCDIEPYWEDGWYVENVDIDLWN